MIGDFRRDLEHLAVNLNLNIVAPIVFYATQGFAAYGIPHLLFIILWSIWIYTMDDALETRRFPLYLWPMLTASLILQPLLTVLVVAGEFLINLKDLTRKESIALELLEGPGNTLIYVAPFLVPLGVSDPLLWAAITMFVTYINCFHKIGHRESCNARLSMVVGLSLATVVGLLYGRWDELFTWLYLAIALTLLVPLPRVKWKLYYNLVWQSAMGPLGFLYLALYIL